MSLCRNVYVKQEMRSTIVCFVCGSASNEPFPLNSKPREHGSFFPFLEHHHVPSGAVPPSSDAVVSSCFLCYSFLNTQWDAYEKNSTPHSKRLYWLKRTDNGPFAGMDSGMQMEFASQYLGIMPTNPDSNPPIQNESSIETSNQSAQFKQEVPDIPEMHKPNFPTRKEYSEDSTVLDLSVPSKPQAVPHNVLGLPVCYVCGDECLKEYLTVVSVHPLPNSPYFQRLLSHPKPPRAKAIDETGHVEVCNRCYVLLLNHWDSLQKSSSVPNVEHSFNIPDHLSNDTNLAITTASQSSSEFMCYTCGVQYPKSFRRDVSVSGESDSQFKFLEKYPRAPGAKAISSSGKVYLCSVCYKAFSRQMRVYQIEDTPENQRIYKVPSEIASSETTVLRDRLTCKASNERSVQSRFCSLCNKQTHILKYVESLPNNSKMYFPFLRDVIRPSSQSEVMDSAGRVLVCSGCYSCLHAQWESFQSAQVPPSQRHYSIQQLMPESKSRNVAHHRTTSPIQVSVPEEPPVSHTLIGTHEPLLTTVPYSSQTRETGHNSVPHLSKDDGDGPQQHICNPLELPFNKPPLMIATSCFICSEYTTPGKTFTISSTPPQNGTRSLEEFPSSSIPFFPFLAKMVSSGAASTERLPTSEDGSPLVCTFCFHSLMAQWLAYDSSPHPEDGNCWQRRYNTHHYVCYICGITTYRKRVRSITVRDFPFLVEHPRPPGALTLQSGESVVTCLTCFESLMSQWKDFERMKLPVEMRKYNWIVLPPPPENEGNHRALPTQDGLRDATPSVVSLCSSSEGVLPDSVPRLEYQATGSGLSHGSKPPSLTMQPGCHPGKPRSNSGGMTTVSPLYHQVAPPHGPSNSLVFSANGSPAFAAASRTSSFAAALRKLAKQAVDPISIDKEMSPVTPVSSPALCQRASPPKRSVAGGGPSGVYLNSHQAPISSPPINAPSSHWAADHRKPLDLGARSHTSNGHSSNRHGEPLSLKVDGMKGHSSGIKREQHLTSNPKEMPLAMHQARSVPVSSSSSVGARPEELPPSHVPSSSSSSSRGFQPYRVLEDSRAHPLTSLPPPPPPHYDSPALASYSYHPAAFLPTHHLPHPAYRFEDPMYLEHCGVLRPSVMHLPTPSGLMAPHPSVPSFYSSSNSGPGVGASRYSRGDALNPALGFVSPGMHPERDVKSESHLKEIHMESKHDLDSRREYERQRDQERRELERRDLERRDLERRDHERRDHERRDHERRDLERRDHERRDLERKEQERRDRERHTGMQRDPSQSVENSHHENDLGSNHRDSSPRASNLGRTSDPAAHLSIVPRMISSSSPPMGPLNLALGGQPHLPPGAPSRDSQTEMQRLRQQEVELWVARQQAVTAAANAEVPPPPPILDESLYKHPYSLQQDQLHLMQTRHGSLETEKPKDQWKEKYTSLDMMPKYPPPPPLEGPLGYARGPPPQPLPHHMGHPMLNGSLLRPDDKGRTGFLYPGHEGKLSAQQEKTMASKLATGNYQPQLQEGMHARLIETEKPYSEWRENSLPASDGKCLLQIPNQSLRMNENGSAERVPQRVQHLTSAREHPIPHLVSRLDMEEERLRAARLEGSSCPPSEDEEENSVVGIQSRLIIVKGPSLELDTSPKKLDFLKSFGLTSQRKKKELELKKFLRRRRALNYQERPLEIENDENNGSKSKLLSFLLFSLGRNHQKLPVSTTRDEKQVDFLSELGLSTQASDIKEDGELVWRAVVEDRARRQGLLLPLRELQDSNLPSHPTAEVIPQRSLKRKLSEETRAYPNGVVSFPEKVRQTSSPITGPLSGFQAKGVCIPTGDGDATSHPASSHKQQSTTKRHRQLLNNGARLSAAGVVSECPPSPQETSLRENVDAPSALPAPAAPLQSTVAVQESGQDSLPKQVSSREFAQEFHQLVLQTTKQQILDQNHSKVSVSPSQSGETNTRSMWNKAPSVPHPLPTAPLPLEKEENEPSCYKWPGMEAVLESYDRYRTEQNLEVEILHERCQHLVQESQDMNTSAEAFSKRMTELLHLKRQLDQERLGHQQALDNLKQCLRHFRS